MGLRHEYEEREAERYEECPEGERYPYVVIDGEGRYCWRKQLANKIGRI
jgi:hypothetical protein